MVFMDSLVKKKKRVVEKSSLFRVIMAFSLRKKKFKFTQLHIMLDSLYVKLGTGSLIITNNDGTEDNVTDRLQDALYEAIIQLEARDEIGVHGAPYSDEKKMSIYRVMSCVLRSINEIEFFDVIGMDEKFIRFKDSILTVSTAINSCINKFWVLHLAVADDFESSSASQESRRVSPPSSD